VNLRLALFALALAASSAAPAQSDDLAAARRAGQVGERFDGYLGYSVTPPANLQRQVQAINIRRRALYSDLASRRGVTTQVVYSKQLGKAAVEQMRREVGGSKKKLAEALLKMLMMPTELGPRPPKPVVVGPRKPPARTPMPRAQNQPNLFED